MSESDSPNNEKSADWKLWPPEDFLSNLTHELRTPLMGIKGYTEILSDESKKELHSKALEAVSTYIEKLAMVIDDIAEYTHELEKRNQDK